jgi:hypothetical protein
MDLTVLTFYHGSAAESVTPTFGLGDDRHDYGKGFYLTDDLSLAKEWAVCRPDAQNGWVHAFKVVDSGLSVLDFQELGVLAWMAELMKHREAGKSRRFNMLSQKFIAKYGVDSSGYDIIRGWRANASYFYIVTEFVHDEIDVDILEELLMLGGLGIQYCIKSPRAFAALAKVDGYPRPVSYGDYNAKYNERDKQARDRMDELISGPANKAIRVMSTLVEGNA